MTLVLCVCAVQCSAVLSRVCRAALSLTLVFPFNAAKVAKGQKKHKKHKRFLKKLKRHDDKGEPHVPARTVVVVFVETSAG